MSELRVEIRRFLDELEECGELWRAVDIRVVAVRVLGRLSNLTTSCVLDPREPSRIPRVSGLVKTPHVLAVQYIVPFESFGSFLEDILAGEIIIADHTISYRTGEARDSRQSPPAEGEPYSWGSIGFVDRASPFVPADHPWSAITFSVSGDSVQHYLKHIPREHRGIDQEIRSSSTPYDGLAGLVKHFTRGSERFDSNHSTSFRVLAPLPFRFVRELTHFEDRLHIGVRAGLGVVEPDFQIGYFVPDADGVPQSGKLDLTSMQIDQEAPAQTFLIHTSLTSGSATLFLSVGSVCVDKMTVTRLPAHGSNPRVEAFRTVDPDLEYFRTGLDPALRSAGNSFEQAVGRLFTFLGFNVDVLGPDKRISEGVDCFAYTTTTTLAIECTTGSIDAGGKLGKLVSRARAIAAAVEQDVLAVIVTPIDRERIASQELSRAGEDGVAVLAREELDHLFQMCLANAPLPSATEYIAAQVPARRPQEPLAGMLRRR